jgi:hypothetical protein
MSQRVLQFSTRHFRLGAALLGAILCLPPQVVFAAPPAPSQCITISEADVPSMFALFNAALATQHPDKVARLFAVDALLIGHNAPKPRSGYMDIRDYYLFFLTTKPRAQVVQRSASTGCGFLIDEGVIEWHFGEDTRPPVTTHYFMLHEYGAGGWRIAHYHDVAIEAPRPLAMAQKAAVAGYLQRAPKAAAKVGKPSTQEKVESGLIYKPGSFRDDIPVFD